MRDDFFHLTHQMQIVDNSANVEDSVGLIGAFIQEIVLAKEHEKAEKEKKEKELDKIQEIATGDQPPAPSSATEDASKDSVEEAARKAAISTPADDKKAKPGSGKGKPATATTPVPAPVSTPAATKPFTTAATPAARVTTAKDAKTGDAGKNGGALAADPNALPAAEPLSNILVRSTGVDGMKQPSRELAEVLSDRKHYDEIFFLLSKPHLSLPFCRMGSH